ncbi:MAG: DUF4325 domain-containing protein [Planctomycetes bacterium]|nr:DUF4325 domain-containing protein [Planctomycetota bacterium]
MNTRETILDLIREKGPLSGADLADLLGITRQAVNKHVRELRQQEKVVKDGVTKGAVYRIADSTPPAVTKEKQYKLSGLQEDEVFEEFELIMNLEKSLSAEALQVVRYAFTEMLNNAIEHAESEFCDVEMGLGPVELHFRIRDRGIGLFRSVQEKFRLRDETDALRELMKGKATTKPEGHTGEGIFFTSKVGEKVQFRSHKIQMTFNNRKDDIFVESKDFIEGTEVTFHIAKRSRRELAEVFDKYAPEEFDYSFDRTEIKVKLYKKEYMSRSEARRLLNRVADFREVILDFEEVDRIGQGFADEIFRVFCNRHPDVRIEYIDIAPELEVMIKHVQEDADEP